MLDYFDLESSLAEEERMLVDSARSFIEGEVEDMSQHWIDGTFPEELLTNILQHPKQLPSMYELEQLNPSLSETTV